jgi:hypothetical protein
LISVPEGARKYDIEPKVFYDAILNGIFDSEEIPGIVVRLGRRIKLNSEKLDQFIESGGQSWPGGWRKEPAQNLEAA